MNYKNIMKPNNEYSQKKLKRKKNIFKTKIKFNTKTKFQKYIFKKKNNK